MQKIAIEPLKETKPRDFTMLIDGVWCEAVNRERIERQSPAHGVVVSTYPASDIADVDKAVAAARHAFDVGMWPQMSAMQRSLALLKIADLVEARGEEFAYLDSLESGKPIVQARSEIAGAVDLWRYAAALARTLHGQSYNTLGPDNLGIVYREPIGLVALITPWNFPFLILSQKLPFALAAGCTAVVKPSEMTSASTLLLGTLLQQAGVPKGVVNIISGYGSKIGSYLTAHDDVDMVSFTGSTAVGKLSMENAVKTLKPVSLELGGKNPQIVFADANLDEFIDAAVFGGYFNAGQCCNAGSRLIVHHSIADEVVARLISLTESLAVGDPLDPRTKMGAMISQEHMNKVLASLDRAQHQGARICCGGKRVDFDHGYFIAPTVLDGVTGDMEVAFQEIFGPVIAVLRFDTQEEAVALANGVDYGLSASIWSQNIDICLAVSRKIKAGTIWINSFMDGAAELPFGGYKQSGLGRELGLGAVEDYTQNKTVNMRIGFTRSKWI